MGDEIAYGAKQLKLEGSLRERVREAMGAVGLDFDSYKDRFTWTLSGGEKRRVALASILSLDPHILLLDEPTAGLDPLTRRAIIRHLQDLHRQGKTLVLSSHRMGDIARVTVHTTVMQNGKSILAGATGAVFSQGKRFFRPGWSRPSAHRQPSSCGAMVGRCRMASPGRMSLSQRCGFAWGGAHERF